MQGFVGEYKSMDLDQATKHDYYSLEDIKEKFDCAIMAEVVEHLTIEQFSEILDLSQSFLKRKGHLIISTPNTFHPHRFLDATHITPWRYDEIGGFLKMNGFKILHIYRVVFNDSMLRRLIRACGAIFLNRYFQLDYAESIMVICRKK